MAKSMKNYLDLCKATEFYNQMMNRVMYRSPQIIRYFEWVL